MFKRRANESTLVFAVSLKDLRVQKGLADDYRFALTVLLDEVLLVDPPPSVFEKPDERGVSGQFLLLEAA